ncbi:P-loop containing nucleoside triphosphate hydrolase protein [Lophiostoma macrostomum CBS 122681]|uniref:P-loop containing nucleoside triphosphate hydrolase protein n=1 Tax=Lophiostoma macrostomum CBS 122681 TaxID=1314788 RepID=A0A6A6TKF9_9PLEO|nr:P-loop containing nucleoside triphosphate hydrolase protein [Lophiostoma macrostomum CBS 122681]
MALPLLLRQIWALIRKNLLLLCLRRPVATFIRALAIPLIVILVVGYSKNFFASPSFYGVSSSSSPIRSLKDVSASTPDHNIVGFMDNGMKNGEISSVISSLSQSIREAGKTPKYYEDLQALSQECASNTKGSSACYGAILFHSSPHQGSSSSSKGAWNYTILGSDSATRGAFIDVRRHDNGPELYLLPLQRALDDAIATHDTSGNATALPSVVNEMLFTTFDQDHVLEERDQDYLVLCIYVFGAIFSFSMIGIVYHMTSYVAAERELGMTSLIDSMLPGGSALRARLIRQISTYLSFALVYFPGWLSVGIVMDSVVFPHTSHGLPVGYHIVSGFAFTSFTLFMVSFFRKAHLSGAIATVIALVFAILPMVLIEQTKTQCTIFSLLFPSANYSYFVRELGQWELSQQRADVYSLPSTQDDWTLTLCAHLVCLVIQILVYPLLALVVEHILFSTASPGRTPSVPTDATGSTVTLTDFCKTYKPSMFSRRKDVHAVVDMNLTAYPGQILCLLGPNGGGKSTTLNCIAGQQKVTSGKIDLDATGGLGYAPQSNVIWPELTVGEHVRIFSDLKCVSGMNNEVISELVKSCDLENKLSEKAKTLSGGQKRKLQLAMMFAGGSKVCCIDEVSTGLDPISRRRIWEILLAERGRRTLIMTTHFLDEADYLADTVAIMYQGSLRAEGTSATLKNNYGNGYTVKVDNSLDPNIALTTDSFGKEASRHQTVYRVASPALAAELIEHLEHQKITDYQLSGPTMEELFLKVTGDTMVSDKDASKLDSSESAPISDTPAASHYELKDGRPISAWNQWWLLFCKRFAILKRRFIPYIVTIMLAIAGAGVAQLLIRSIKALKCPVIEDLINTQANTYSLHDVVFEGMVVGPPEIFNDSLLQTMVNLYPSNEEGDYPGYGFSTMDSIKRMITVVDTFDYFSQSVRQWQEIGSSDVLGGIWLGDTPTVLYHVESPWYGLYMQNILNVALSNVPIAAEYSTFPSTSMPRVYDLKVLMFMIYFGLIMAAYPAFFALYPTNERISNVRSMQYSNGIRPIPLWLSHLAFDSIAVVLISVVGAALLSLSTPVWYGMAYVFIILVLYGSASALVSYMMSMVAKSAVAAWFYVALFNVIMYFAYFGALVGTQSSTGYEQLEHVNNAVYFGVAMISPIVSLEKALAVGLRQFAFTCNGHSPGSIYLFGGPILYLILQNMVLFAILLWWDGAFRFPLRTKSAIGDPEGTEMQSNDVMEELRRLHSGTTDLRVESVSKSFGKNLAVDNVTFGVKLSEIFALLGPNGAGKSTLISMIRGDMRPSTKGSHICIAGHSILSAPIAARANLGVCPQFDSADVLTVTETLRFFAKTRGVKDVDHNVRTVIEACGLEPWAHQLAQKLSGGTKRKLSLAVALVGNPRVLVLDEPSSALDANAKRNMWRTLQSVSKGRAVVLTTHSMEEADALADRIGIVQSRLLASGDREELIKRAGDAYHVHLVARSAPRTSQHEILLLKDWVLKTYPNAKISRTSQGGQLRFEVAAIGHSLIELIKTLETVKAGLGVEFYSVGKATLDEVFENIVRRYGNDGRGEK